MRQHRNIPLTGGVSPPHQVGKGKAHIAEAVVLSPIILSPVLGSVIQSLLNVHKALGLGFQFLRSQQIRKSEDNKLVHRQQQRPVTALI